MVAKHIIQLIITGAQVVGKAFGQAVRQEIRMSQEAAKASATRSELRNLNLVTKKTPDNFWGLTFRRGGERNREPPPWDDIGRGQADPQLDRRGPVWEDGPAAKELRPPV